MEAVLPYTAQSSSICFELAVHAPREHLQLDFSLHFNSPVGDPTKEGGGA